MKFLTWTPNALNPLNLASNCHVLKRVTYDSYPNLIDLKFWRKAYILIHLPYFSIIFTLFFLPNLKLLESSHAFMDKESSDIISIKQNKWMEALYANQKIKCTYKIFRPIEDAICIKTFKTNLLSQVWGLAYKYNFFPFTLTISTFASKMYPIRNAAMY